MYTLFQRRTQALAKARSGNSCVLASDGRLIDLMSRNELPDLTLGDTARLRAPA